MTKIIKVQSKKFKKLLVLTLSIALLANTNAITAFADDTTSQVINYNSQIPLYDEKNNVVAYYYELQNKGYLITDATGSEYIEYSKEANSSFLEQGKTYYYGGPLAYFEKSNTDSNTLTDCKTEETMKKSSFDSTLEGLSSGNGAKHANDCKAATAETIEPIFKRGTVENKITNPTYPYDYNLTGTCGSVAAAIVLMYYHDYVKENFVPSQYVPSEKSGKTLVKYLIKYLEEGNSGSTYSSVLNGLSQYFSKNSIQATAKAVNPELGSNKTMAQIKSVIDSNKPCMVGILGHPTYHDHWVVATGYSTDSSVATDTSTTDDSDTITADDSSWGDDSSDSDSSWADDSSDSGISWGDDSSDSDSSWADDSSDSDSSWADDSSDSSGILGGVTSWLSGLLGGGGDSSSDASTCSTGGGILSGLSSIFKVGGSLSGIIGNLFKSDASVQTGSSNNLGSANPKMSDGSEAKADSTVNAVTGSAITATDSSTVPATTDSAVAATTDSAVPATTDSAVPATTDSAVPATADSTVNAVTSSAITATDNSLNQDNPADTSTSQTTTENVKYGASSVIVNDGWGAQNVNVNLKYCDGCVYLQ